MFNPLSVSIQAAIDINERISGEMAVENGTAVIRATRSVANDP